MKSDVLNIFKGNAEWFLLLSVCHSGSWQERGGTLKGGEGGFNEGTIYNVLGGVSVRQQCSRASSSDRPLSPLKG